MIKTELKTIRVLIADDHILLRDGFQNMLHRHTEIKFVGAAENGKELIEMAETHQPDIIFTDISMPVMDGVQATRMLSSRLPDTGIIALTMYNEEHLIVQMLEAGAKGYIVKSASKAELLEAIHAVYDNDNYYCRRTTANLAKMIGKSNFSPFRKAKETDFTEGEREVIRLVCMEFSNKEIAARLNLSVRTIEGRREKIQEKMNVHSTAGMVVYAIKKGLFTLET